MKKSGFAAYVCAALLTLAGMLAGQPHQADAARGLARDAGFVEIDVHVDLTGRDRVLVARRSG